MSSTTKSTTNGAAVASKFTDEGLPLERALVGAAITMANAGDRGLSRRIDCRPPRLVSALTIRPSKGKWSKSHRTIPLELGANECSLIDDDDDEVVDYFDVECGGRAPVPGPTAPTDVAASNPRWNVREHCVPTLPSFYPLEKSSRFVPRASALVLAARVAAVLQDRSIATCYDAANAKVDCVSKSHVEFRVRLYHGREGCDLGIIVEVQRRSGFGLSYAQDVHAILDAAEGKSIDDCRDEIIPICCVASDGSVGNEEEEMDSLEPKAGFAPLQVISDILCPRGGKAEAVVVERRDFALSSLASLTSSGIMGRAAVHFSNEMLSSEACANLRSAVFSNLGQDLPNWTSQLLSLKILANIFASARSGTSLVQLLFGHDYAILLQLVANIENASLSPHAANLSCLVLKIAYISETIQDMMPSRTKERLLAALTRAAACGREFHIELEEHSKKCLELMLLGER